MLVKLFLFAFLVVQASCKSSLTFVIDNTASMLDEIVQIRNTANIFAEAVANGKSRDADEIVLVTFNDPDASFKIRTRKEEELKAALESIELNGGNDCPEMALSGIKLALEESKPRSTLLVFTDASAKDYKKFDEIKTLCQEKQSEITFILTGSCGSTSAEDYLVYQKIADSCHGKVHKIQKNELSQLLKDIQEANRSRWTEHKSESAPAPANV